MSDKLQPGDDCHHILQPEGPFYRVLEMRRSGQVKLVREGIEPYVMYASAFVKLPCRASPHYFVD